MQLYLLDDDKNSFQFVIASLTTLLPLCNSLRAEQIAMIVHNNGECSIYQGFAPEIYVLYAAFQKVGLTVQIREYKSNTK
jgi:ATP-dependent Clp protease adapter protein ClpS